MAFWPTRMFRGRRHEKLGRSGIPKRRKGYGGHNADPEAVKGLIAKYAYWLEKEGYSKDTPHLGYVKMLARRGTGALRVKKRVAQNLQNFRLLKITFNTFRHWGATMIYHHT